MKSFQVDQWTRVVLGWKHMEKALMWETINKWQEVTRNYNRDADADWRGQVESRTRSRWKKKRLRFEHFEQCHMQKCWCSLVQRGLFRVLLLCYLCSLKLRGLVWFKWPSNDNGCTKPFAGTRKSHNITIDRPSLGSGRRWQCALQMLAMMTSAWSLKMHRDVSNSCCTKRTQHDLSRDRCFTRIGVADSG